MYKKARLFGDCEMADRILEATEPHDHKRIEQQVRGFNQDKWQTHRCGIVYRGNLAKFSHNGGLRKRLLRSTDTILAEANPKDDIWELDCLNKIQTFPSPNHGEG
jgi:ribA/ribD-fused uncharacterized protein